MYERERKKQKKLKQEEDELNSEHQFLVGEQFKLLENKKKLMGKLGSANKEYMNVSESIKESIESRLRPNTAKTLNSKRSQRRPQTAVSMGQENVSLNTSVIKQLRAQVSNGAMLKHLDMMLELQK